MPAILSNYEYDIFISYRHNDNRSGWVTEFVTALQEELAATIKEPLSIYFDKNPHDGLLETHHVDKSLEGKLKCLIFIPILSQTYCDPKSFAWQHEFCVFNKLSQFDQIERDIKLANGNVASRILPVKIHELDPIDTTLLEKEMGGVLRAIDFIFKSPGVNRPLRSKDDDIKEITHFLFYRDQINKTANAIKDILATLKGPEHQTVTINHLFSVAHPRQPKTKLILFSSAILLIIFTAIFIYSSQILSSKKLIEEKSIAILPFVDMSPDQDQEYFADGLSEELLNLLAQIKGLKVIGRTSSFQFKGKNGDLREIGKKLNVDRILEGSVRKSDQYIKITAQLIDTRDGSHLWSQTFNRKLDNVFEIQDEISRAVVDELKIDLLNNALPVRKFPVNAEAYNFFARGKYFYETVLDTNATNTAKYYFKEAIRLDSTFALAWTYLSMTYWRTSRNSVDSSFLAAKNAAQKALDLDPTLSTALINMAEILDNEYDLVGAADKIVKALKIDPTNPYVLRNAGRFYTLIGNYEKAIKYCEQALLNDPIQRTALGYLANAYFYSGDYSKAIGTLKKLEEIWKRGNGEQAEFILLGSGYIEEAEERAIRYNYQNLLACIYFKKGQKKKAIEICDQLANTCSSKCAYSIAVAYAYGDMKEQTFSWLERSYLNKEAKFAFLMIEPVFKKYYDEPVFKELVQKIKFP